MFYLFCLHSEICYIFAQIRRNWPQKTRHIDCLATLPKPAPSQLGMSPTLSWTNANSLTLMQFCKDLKISETELDSCKLHSPAQFQADVLRSTKSLPSNAVACLKQTRIKSTKTAVKPIIGRINAPRLPNLQYQKCSCPPWRKEDKASVQVWRRPRQRSPRRGRSHPTRLRRHPLWFVLALLLLSQIWPHWLTLLLFLII